MRAAWSERQRVAREVLIVGGCSGGARQVRTLFAAVLTAVLLAGCGGGDRATATWDLAPGQTLGPGTTQVTALVSRIGCNNGVTGSVDEPDVQVSQDTIMLTFTVSPGPPQSASCPGNDAVAYVVQLPEPLGTRSLVDGACTDDALAATLPCSAGGVRHTS